MERSSFLKRFRPDPFVSCLGLVILLAYLSPEIGAAHGSFSLRKAADFGVSAIFFFYGIGMSPASLRAGLSNWRLHLLVHLTTFLIFPSVVLAAREFFVTESTRLLWLGVFYVAVLPSTVSSSVVMVSIARGNVPAAIFNAGVSGLLGVFLTPLWMSLFLHAERQGMQLFVSIRDLTLIVALPIVLGMMLNSRFGDWMARNRRYMKYFDQGVVLLIVYTSFCESFAARAFDGFGTKTLVLLGLGLTGLFFAVYGIVALCCRFFGFNREDTITVQFCGSKKSLMHGTAMSQVLFADIPGPGVVLLPIMLYHALQLIVVGVIAKHKKPETSSPRFSVFRG